MKAIPLSSGRNILATPIRSLTCCPKAVAIALEAEGPGTRMGPKPVPIGIGVKLDSRPITNEIENKIWAKPGQTFLITSVGGLAIEHLSGVIWERRNR